MSDMKAAREAARNAVMQGQLSRQVNAYEIDAAIDAYIAALSEAHAIVPREPTEAMVMHGAAALEPNTFYVEGPPEGRKRQALMAYRAMLNAAEPPPTGEK